MIVEKSAVIPAQAQKVYDLLADYRVGHPAILPKEFTKLEVLEGGRGAGTKTRITMKSWGQTRVMRQEVFEPEPGRVLLERDLDTDLVTTFTVKPLSDTLTELTIKTVWQAKSGLLGWIEGHVTKLVMRPMYETELQNIAAYMQKR